MSQFEQEQAARAERLSICRDTLQKMIGASAFGEPPEVLEALSRYLLLRINTIEVVIDRANNETSPARDLVEYNIWKGEFKAAKDELAEIDFCLRSFNAHGPAVTT